MSSRRGHALGALPPTLAYHVNSMWKVPNPGGLIQDDEASAAASPTNRASPARRPAMRWAPAPKQRGPVPPPDQLRSESVVSSYSEARAPHGRTSSTGARPDSRVYWSRHRTTQAQGRATSRRPAPDARATPRPALSSSDESESEHVAHTGGRSSPPRVRQASPVDADPSRSSPVQQQQQQQQRPVIPQLQLRAQSRATDKYTSVEAYLEWSRAQQSTGQAGGARSVSTHGPHSTNVQFDRKHVQPRPSQWYASMSPPSALSALTRRACVPVSPPSWLHVQGRHAAQARC